MKTESNHQAGIQRTRKRTWMGIGLLNLSALGYAVAMLSANMAVKNGIDIHTTNAMRYTLALVFLFLFQRIRRHNAKLPPRERVISLSLGLTVFIMATGYLGATQYIPISLAVLIFYSFPLFVVVISRFTEKEPMTKMRLIAIIIAFVGLGFALEIGSIARLNWQGVAYGFVSSLGCTSFIIINSRTMRTVDPQSVSLHCLFGGVLFFWIALLFTDSQTITLSQGVMLKVVLSGISIAFAYVTFFTGLKIVGSVRSAMLLNMEPVLTIILAAVLLGERLSGFQLFGAILVITGIVMITRDPST